MPKQFHSLTAQSNVAIHLEIYKLAAAGAGEKHNQLYCALRMLQFQYNIRIEYIFQTHGVPINKHSLDKENKNNIQSPLRKKNTRIHRIENC